MTSSPVDFDGQSEQDSPIVKKTQSEQNLKTWDSCGTSSVGACRSPGRIVEQYAARRRLRKSKRKRYIYTKRSILLQNSIGITKIRYNITNSPKMKRTRRRCRKKPKLPAPTPAMDLPQRCRQQPKTLNVGKARLVTTDVVY